MTSRPMTSCRRARASCRSGATFRKPASSPSSRSTALTRGVRARTGRVTATRYLGLRIVLARSFARIHWQNLVNFGVLPLTFADLTDYDRLEPGDVIRLSGVHETLRSGRKDFTAPLGDSHGTIALRHDLSERQVELLLSGGVINWLRERLAGPDGATEERGERALLLNPG